MMLITQQVYTEGPNADVQRLNTALKQFHQTDPFSNGFDWENQYLWARMTDEQCVMFVLKHPEYAGRFKETK